MTIHTHGYATHSATSELVPFTFERRDPRPTDVVIDILYCGICHSDIHTARNEWGWTHYPYVPGHEIVGRVAAVGDKVSKYKVGDLVGVGCLVDSCRHCDSCNEGLEQYCENGFTGTYDNEDKIGGTPHKITFGGYSDKITVDERFVLHIPDNLDPAAAAPAALRRHHNLFAAEALEGRARTESRRHRPWRVGAYGSEACPCHGRARGDDHHVAEKGRGREETRRR